MSEADPKREPAPDLAEALRDIGATGRASIGAAADAAKALRGLVAADLSLARGAMGRALAYTGVAIAFGGSAWLLVVAAMVALAHRLGLPWFTAMLIGAGLSLATTAFAIWQVVRYLEHTRLQATRRQLARLGFGEPSEPEPPAPSSGDDAADRMPDDAAVRPPPP